jgi:hypothetical protein
LVKSGGKPPDGAKAREVLKTRGRMKEYDDSIK